jgi:hypothetical protein
MSDHRHLRWLGRAGLALAGAGLALGLAGAPGAAAGERMSGFGVVTAKNSSLRTVQILGSDYRVTDTTQLIGSDGQEITFEEIPLFRNGADGNTDGVQFEAERGAGGFELERLRVGPMPR